MITRRLFIASVCAGTIAMPWRAHAQATSRTVRIGLLAPASRQSLTHMVEALLRGLSELGYVEGRNLVLLARYAEGANEKLSALAQELLSENPDIVAVTLDPAVHVMKQLTQTIPIVMLNSSDPVGTKFVNTLARPGGNITGLTSVSPELSAKRVQFLRELLPKLSRFGVIRSPDVAGHDLELKEISTAARNTGLTVHVFSARNVFEFERAIAAMKGERIVAYLMLQQNPGLFSSRKEIAEIALKNRLLSIYPNREFVDAGGLLSYGTDVPELYRRAATFIDKILRGTKPADLPVEQPTKFELTINGKTAKALGLAIPPALMISANKVIE